MKTNSVKRNRSLFQPHGLIGSNRSKTRLTLDSPVTRSRLNSIVKKMHRAFKNTECIRNTWNCLPSLFYTSNIDKLIDAKYLAAIREINFIQKKGEHFSIVELYFTWLLFKSEYCSLPTSLFSLTDFAEFQKSWLSLNETYGDLVSYEHIDVKAEDHTTEELNGFSTGSSSQLEIEFA